VTQFSCPGECAVFDIDEQLGFEPDCLGLFDFSRQRLDVRFQLFGALAQALFDTGVKSVFHLPGVNQFAILAAPEINAVELTAIKCDAGKDEGLTLPTCSFGPIGVSPRAIFGIFALRDQPLKLEAACSFE
jgi:hypothetical protein